MKHYFKRLWKAICGKNFYPYYEYDYNYPLVWELDNYIINLVRVNLPNYNMWHPIDLTEIEWDIIKNEMVELANKLSFPFNYYYNWIYFDYEAEDTDYKRFNELLLKYFINLRD